MLPKNCKQQAFLQGIWVSDPWPCWGEILEAKQPEEQHGLRPGRRLEEHLLTANLLLDKAAAAGITMWIVSLDLSKAFIWPRTLANIVGNSTRTRGSRTLSVVVGECIWWTTRRGHNRWCATRLCFKPTTFQRSSRMGCEAQHFDLGDALGNLVDLRFADDILLFANFGPEVSQILDKFGKAVGKVGLRLNDDKTVILTNEAQPPNTLVTKDGLILKVLEWNQGQKWLGCIWTACGSMMQHMNLAYHMEQGTKTMHANRWILQDTTTSIYTRLKYFNAAKNDWIMYIGFAYHLSGRGPRPTPWAQPPPSPSLRSTGLDLASSPAMPEPPG